MTAPADEMMTRANDTRWRAELRARLKACRVVLGRAGLSVRKVPRFALFDRKTGQLAHPTPLTVSELERFAKEIEGSL
jgi:hypothetical protein